MKTNYAHRMFTNTYPYSHLLQRDKDTIAGKKGAFGKAGEAAKRAAARFAFLCRSSAAANKIAQERREARLLNEVAMAA